MEVAQSTLMNFSRKYHFRLAAILAASSSIQSAAQKKMVLVTEGDLHGINTLSMQTLHALTVISVLHH